MAKKWVFVLMASMLSLNVAAADYTCPASLEIKEKWVAEPANWAGMYEKASGEIAYTDGKEISDTVKLAEITLYSGEPKEQASLVPDNADSLTEEEGDSLWSFKSVDEQKQHPLYIACRYDGSSLGVFQKIATPVKACTWHFKPEAANNILSCVPAL
jgi:hypothetical protein